MLSPAGAGSEFARSIPRARGLALGYMVSPADAGSEFARGIPRARGLALATRN